ncbi:anaerobic ribonucleoside-triphosphate reductase activating protein [Sphingobacterium kyonggiense]
MAKPLFDISPFTLLDYPNKAACIFWFAGCNMRCLYCYNPDIVLGKGKIGIDEAKLFLQSRRGLLQAVVFSGGECSMHPDLMKLAKIAKEMGYLIKVDTNGTRPKVLKAMYEEGLLDYVALDFKALSPKYKEITLFDDFKSFEQSLEFLISTRLTFEVRTTVHGQLLSNDDLQEMLFFLEGKGYVGNYYLQAALNNVKTLSDLSYSSFGKEKINFSSRNIQVIIRA